MRHLQMLFLLVLLNGIFACDDIYNDSPEGIAKRFLNSLREKKPRQLSALLPASDDSRVFSEIMNLSLDDYEDELNHFRKNLVEDFQKMIYQKPVNYEQAEIKDLIYRALRQNGNNIESGVVTFLLANSAKKYIKIKLVVLRKQNFWYLMGYEYQVPNPELDEEGKPQLKI